jgi:hypothetical protein
VLTKPCLRSSALRPRSTNRSPFQNWSLHEWMGLVLHHGTVQAQTNVLHIFRSQNPQSSTLVNSWVYSGHGGRINTSRPSSNLLYYTTHHLFLDLQNKYSCSSMEAELDWSKPKTRVNMPLRRKLEVIHMPLILSLHLFQSPYLHFLFESGQGNGYELCLCFSRRMDSSQCACEDPKPCLKTA